MDSGPILEDSVPGTVSIVVVGIGDPSVLSSNRSCEHREDCLNKCCVPPEPAKSNCSAHWAHPGCSVRPHKMRNKDAQECKVISVKSGSDPPHAESCEALCCSDQMDCGIFWSTPGCSIDPSRKFHSKDAQEHHLCAEGHCVATCCREVSIHPFSNLFSLRSSLYIVS